MNEGIYYFNWWVGISGAGSQSDSIITLKNITDNLNVVVSNIDVSGNQIIGSALISVTSVPKAFELVNNSTDFIQLAMSPVQANLIILQLI